MSGSSSPVDYGALADAVDISDITSDEDAAQVLRQLRDDEPKFEYALRLHDDGISFALKGGDDFCHCLFDARGMGVLGYYVGRGTLIKSLSFSIGQEFDVDVLGPFLLGLESNQSIQNLSFVNSHVPCQLSQLLAPFIKGNSNLMGLRVERCAINAEQSRSLSLALRGGKSLVDVFIGDVIFLGARSYPEESLIDMIEALKMHPHMLRLSFRRFTMRQNAGAALSHLLGQSADLRELIFKDNDIDDSGVTALAGGLAHCRSLRLLTIVQGWGRTEAFPITVRGHSITASGWRALSALLEKPNSTLRLLNLRGNGIDEESAAIFSNALANNNTLERIYLGQTIRVERTGECWAALSRVLCDTTSVNSTFLSNHRLHRFEGPIPQDGVPGDVASLLTLNQENDKKAVAFRKVLLYHDDFDMQPLFEWDLKVLPYVVGWLERAAGYEIESDAFNQKRKLSAIYQFVRGMPELSIDGITGASTKSDKVGGEKRPHAAAFEG